MAVFPDLIPGIVPFGSICTLSGPPLLGKTAMVASWAARLRDGRSICGHPTNRPTDIAVLQVDRDWRADGWYARAGIADIRYYSLPDDPSVNWDHFRYWNKVPSLFRAALDRLHLLPGGVLIADPLAMWIPGNLIDYKNVSIGLRTLAQVAKPYQITILGLFHTSKQKADRKDRYLRPQERILGSGAQLGFSDTTVYMLGPEDLDTDYYGVGLLPHLSPPELHKFSRDSQGLFIPYDGGIESVGVSLSPDEDSTRTGQPASRFPSDALPLLIPESSPVTFGQVVQRAGALYGVSRRTTARFLRQQTDAGAIMKVGQGYQRVPLGALEVA